MEPGEPRADHAWTARRIRPVAILYVIGIFLAFMAVAYFGFHSLEAVGALAAAAVGSVVSLLPGVLKRMEYRLTSRGLEKRAVGQDEAGTFEEVFRWDDLARVVRTSTGYKYYERLPDSGPLKRFWNLHLSAEYSGEFHVEEEDRPKVSRVLASRPELSPPRDPGGG